VLCELNSSNLNLVSEREGKRRIVVVCGIILKRTQLLSFVWSVPVLARSAEETIARFQHMRER
jgi:hypothetical protein